MIPLLELRHLNIGFPVAGGAAANGAERTLPAVRDLSFSISAGEVLGLVGESASGKSITSLAIMRLLPGQALVSGKFFFRRMARRGACWSCLRNPCGSCGARRLR